MSRKYNELFTCIGHLKKFKKKKMEASELFDSHKTENTLESYARIK